MPSKRPSPSASTRSAVAVALRLGDVVGREDHGRAAAGEAEHELPEALALARVEAGRGLVEQQDRGLGEQPDRDVDPLLVAARERPDLVVAPLGERGLLEHPLDRRLDVVDLLEAGEQAQVLGHRQAPVERRLLRHPADLARGRWTVAGVGLADPGEDREQGRLAGAVGADHREQLAGGGGEADLPQRRAVAEALAQAARLDRLRRGAGWGRAHDRET